MPYADGEDFILTNFRGVVIVKVTDKFWSNTDSSRQYFVVPNINTVTKYLNPQGVWESDCGNSWYSTEEEAKAAVRMLKDNPLNLK